MNKLASSAAIQQAKARDIIGDPGPGTDLIVHPTSPLSDHWQIEAKTSAGRKFMHLFFPLIVSNRELPLLKQQASDWGLKFRTDWSNIVEQKVD